MEESLVGIPSLPPSSCHLLVFSDISGPNFTPRLGEIPGPFKAKAVDGDGVRGDWCFFLGGVFDQTAEKWRKKWHKQIRSIWLLGNLMIFSWCFLLIHISLNRMLPSVLKIGILLWQGSLKPGMKYYIMPVSACMVILFIVQWVCWYNDFQCCLLHDHERVSWGFHLRCCATSLSFRSWLTCLK